MTQKIMLGVLSDTHLVKTSTAISLSQALLRGPFREVAALFHAGDIIDDALDGCFGDIPFYPVRGNMDTSNSHRPFKRLVTIERWRIGLIHGWGRPHEVVENVLQEFANENLDVLIFGHSHTPCVSRVGKTLLFNPGSATDHRGRARLCSVGLLELGDDISALHIYLPGASV